MGPLSDFLFLVRTNSVITNIITTTNRALYKAFKTYITTLKTVIHTLTHPLLVIGILKRLH